MMLLMIMAMGVAFAEGPRPEISVLAKNEVLAGQPIRVKDIAGVSFVTIGAQERALDLTILPAVDSFKTIRIKNSDMVMALKAKVAASNEIGDLKWTYFVPEETEIRAVPNQLPYNAVASDVLIRLQKKCEDCSIKITDLKLPQLEGKVTYYEVDYDPLKLTGSLLLPVHVIASGTKKTYWITGQIKISKQVPVTTRQINTGERIASQDVRLETVDITFARDTNPTMSEVQGLVAARLLGAGQPVFRSDLKKELAIQRGQVVRVLVGNDSFEISGQAVAEEAGYVGDMVKLKNSESQKISSGTVIEKGVVRIQ